MCACVCVCVEGVKGGECVYMCDWIECSVTCCACIILLVVVQYFICVLLHICILTLLCHNSFN